MKLPAYGQRLLVAIALIGLALGGGLWWCGDTTYSNVAWTLGTLPILLALLYTLGHRHARHTLARPWIAGALYLLVGLLLVGVAILLGG